MHVSQNHFLSSLTSYDPSRRYAKIPNLLAYKKTATLLQFLHFVIFDLRYPKYSMDKIPKHNKIAGKGPELPLKFHQTGGQHID